jgi:phosphatidate phosphatase APP1
VRFGLISDVDDTVMVTALPRPFVAFWNTFVLDEHARIPTPGMAVLYERLVRAHPGSPVIYLSTGAWNVAPTLTRFLSRNLYPAGPLLLTDWGPTHDRWFRSGRAHKEENLRRIASEFPDIRWLLVGDDGQHDEELYARFAAEHPERVAAVAIRRLSTGEAVLAGGRTKADQHGANVPWVSASDGSNLADQLADVGVL